jgi:hypothetical protein
MAARLVSCRAVPHGAQQPVVDADRSERVGKAVGVELRHPARARNRTDVRDQRDFGLPQQRDELVDRARRVPDGEERSQLRNPLWIDRVCGRPWSSPIIKPPFPGGFAQRVAPRFRRDGVGKVPGG